MTQANKPHTFANGTNADADEVNANFDEIYLKYNDHDELDTTVHGVGTSSIASTADIDTHENKDTGVHGVGTSTVATTGDIDTHEGKTTGVHGVGTSTVATEEDISNHNNQDNAHNDRITTNENDISNLITIVDDGRWDVFSTTSIPSDIEVTFFITNSNFHLKYIDNENNNTYTHDTGISTGPIAANGRRFILFNAGWDSSTDFVNVRFTVFEISLP